MSHQVQIDYRHIAIQCESICEVAENVVKELEEMLSQIKGSASSLLNYQTKALETQIEGEKASLLRRIEEVRQKAEQDAVQGVVRTDSDVLRQQTRENTVQMAEALRREADRLRSQRIVEYEGLLQSILKDDLQENYQKLLQKAKGEAFIPSAVQRLLDSIEDVVLRHFTYLAYLQNDTLSGEALLAAGRALSEQTYEQRCEAEEEKIRAELAAAKLDGKIIARVLQQKGDNARESLSVVRSAATQEIVGEKIRQKSLKIILKAVQERGFIVDKKNIKINRETNEVIVVALKASGEKAQFRIYLDGKFIYDFRGYEGQACQKDIGPFMKALEDVYGMEVSNRTEIWKNPDKISSMKYQTINTNKNRG